MCVKIFNFKKITMKWLGFYRRKIKRDVHLRTFLIRKKNKYSSLWFSCRKQVFLSLEIK